MPKKYRLIQRPQEPLQRIVAERTGPWGEAGTVGGYVETAVNLDQEGDCWIYDDAAALSMSRVKDAAELRGNAETDGKALVWGGSSIRDECKVTGLAQVGPNCTLKEAVFVEGTANVSGFVYLVGSYVITEDIDGSLENGIVVTPPAP